MLPVCLSPHVHCCCPECLPRGQARAGLRKMDLALEDAEAAIECNAEPVRADAYFAKVRRATAFLSPLSVWLVIESCHELLFPLPLPSSPFH